MRLAVGLHLGREGRNSVGEHLPSQTQLQLHQFASLRQAIITAPKANCTAFTVNTRYYNPNPRDSDDIERSYV